MINNRIFIFFLYFLVSKPDIIFSSESPTLTPFPVLQETPTSTPTPVPVYAKDWVEFSPGSASGPGISKGYGSPQRGIQVILDKDGEPVIAWDSLLDGYDYSVVHVLKWDGAEWKELGRGDISASGLVIGLNHISLDPADNKIVLTGDFYSSSFLKFDGTRWIPWINDGIDDPDGLEFWTDFAFMPDNALIALYHHGYGPTPSHFRVKKYVDGVWKEFSPGSGTENGIADSDEPGNRPQIFINQQGEIFAVWQQHISKTTELVLKKWTGQKWEQIFFDRSPRSEKFENGCWKSLHPLSFDKDGNPIFAYSKAINDELKGRVIKWTQGAWQPVGYDGTDENGFTIPGRTCRLPIVLITPWNYPVVIWYDRNASIYAKYYDGKEWKELGIGSASGDGIDKFSWSSFDAVINQKNELIFAYASLNTKDIYVKKYQLIPPDNYQTPPPSPTPTPIPGWFVLDGFGGVHASDPKIPLPVLPYFMPFNIARDLEPDPLGRGWYMLDGFGGIHTSSPDLPKPTELPYFSYDIARNLEIVNTDHGYEFYMLDGYGVIHSTDKNFKQEFLPWFGFDIARNLEPDPNSDAWIVLDGYGLSYSSKEIIESYPLQSVWSWAPLVRSMVLFPNHTNVVMDAWGGRHTNPRKPAKDVVKGLPGDFYFPGFDIIWDLELIPAKK